MSIENEQGRNKRSVSESPKYSALYLNDSENSEFFFTEIQPFYDFFSIIIISSSSAAQIKKLNGPHVAPWPWFNHVRTGTA